MRRIKPINKKRKKYVIIIASIIIIAIWLALVIDVNIRLPQNTKQCAPVGTWIECDNLEIKGVNQSVYGPGEFKEAVQQQLPLGMGRPSNKEQGIIATVSVRNNSDEDVDLWLYFSQNFICEAYPSGFANSLEAMGAPVGIIPAHTQEPIEVKLSYTLCGNKYYIKKELVQKWHFHLVNQIYPVKKYVELN